MPNIRQATRAFNPRSILTVEETLPPGPYHNMPRQPSGCRLRAALFQPGSNHRYAEASFQAIIEDRADDDVGIVADLLANAGGPFVNFEQRHVAPARNRDENALCARNAAVVQKR